MSTIWILGAQRVPEI